MPDGEPDRSLDYEAPDEGCGGDDGLAFTLAASLGLARDNAEGRRYGEEELLELLTGWIAQLLDARRDWLLGKLYRMDVRERDILAALAVPDARPARALARLVLERQRERLAARARYRSPPLDEDEGALRW